MLATPPRLRAHAYMLIEVLPDGSLLRETFQAPSNAEAVERVQDVLEGRKAELWRDRQIVCCWKPAPSDAAPAVSCFEPAQACAPLIRNG